MPPPADIDVTSEECNEKVRRLDPLGLDEELRKLPELNESADTGELTRVLRGALPSAERVDSFDPHQCLAAMRDLGMYLGSLKRHGVTAFEVVPGATGIFRRLGRRTHMIPRDTVYHYTCWNPVGERERLYSGHPMERSLVGAVRTCVPELAHAVELAGALRGVDPRSPAHADKLAALAGHLTAADRAMTDVLAGVTPEFFARVLRPYFEEVSVAGRVYMGPAAAHVPLFLVDVLLWASDRSGREYLAFCEEVASHTLPEWRERYEEWSASPSMASRVVEALGGPCTASEREHVRTGARELREALRSLTSFRGKHLVMARRAYRPDLRLYELGSGGGSTDLLEEILALTRRNHAAIGSAAAR